METIKKCMLILIGVLVSSMLSVNVFSAPGYLGVNFEEITDEYAKEHQLPVSYGVHIVSIIDGYGAEKAGIKPGDIVIEIDGKKIEKSGMFSPIIAEKGAGEKISLTLLRDGKTILLEAVLAEKPDSSIYKISTDSKENFNIQIAKPYMLHLEKGSSITLGGMYLSELNSDLAEYFNTKNGYLVINVAKGSAAMKAGFKPGDVILSVGDNQMGTEKDFQKLYEQASEGQELNFKAIRKGKEISLKMKLESDEIGTLDWFVNPLVYKIYAKESAKAKAEELGRKFETQIRKIREESERVRAEAEKMTSEEAKKMSQEKLIQLEEKRKDIEMHIKERMKELQEKDIDRISIKVEADYMKKMEQKMKEMEMRLKELEKKLKEAEAKNK